MLPFPNVMDLFADEFSGLCSRRFAFASILAGTFDGFLLRHGKLLCSFFLDNVYVLQRWRFAASKTLYSGG
jgi:hypothetical protein